MFAVVLLSHGLVVPLTCLCGHLPSSPMSFGTRNRPTLSDSISSAMGLKAYDGIQSP